MRSFLSWAGRNLVRFVVVWVVVAGAVAAIVDFDQHDVVPHSPLKVLFVPVALLLILFVAVFSAAVALALFSPVLAPVLLAYLAVLWWSRRIVRGRARRIAAVLLAMVPLAFMTQNDWQVLTAAFGVMLVYGSVVRLPRGHEIAVLAPRSGVIPEHPHAE